jgi:hypothetical protein
VAPSPYRQSAFQRYTAWKQAYRALDTGGGGGIDVKAAKWANSFFALFLAHAAMHSLMSGNPSNYHLLPIILISTEIEMSAEVTLFLSESVLHCCGKSIGFKTDAIA